jgi:hypothetical protein
MNGNEEGTPRSGIFPFKGWGSRRLAGIGAQTRFHLRREGVYLLPKASLCERCLPLPHPTGGLSPTISPVLSPPHLPLILTTPPSSIPRLFPPLLPPSLCPSLYSLPIITPFTTHISPSSPRSLSTLPTLILPQSLISSIYLTCPSPRTSFITNQSRRILLFSLTLNNEIMTQFSHLYLSTAL